MVSPRMSLKGTINGLRKMAQNCSSSLSKHPILCPSYVLSNDALDADDTNRSTQFKHAHDPETRKRALQASESKLEINVPLLTKALDLRRRLAALMNYKTWADYVEEDKMIKTGDAVKDVRGQGSLMFFPLFNFVILVPGGSSRKAYSCRAQRSANANFFAGIHRC
jgi:Peptidase family M3